MKYNFEEFIKPKNSHSRFTGLTVRRDGILITSKMIRLMNPRFVKIFIDEQKRSIALEENEKGFEVKNALNNFIFLGKYHNIRYGRYIFKDKIRNKYIFELNKPKFFKKLQAKVDSIGRA